MVVVSFVFGLTSYNFFRHYIYRFSAHYVDLNFEFIVNAFSACLKMYFQTMVM